MLSRSCHFKQVTCVSCCFLLAGLVVQLDWIGIDSIDLALLPQVEAGTLTIVGPDCLHQAVPQACLRMLPAAAWPVLGKALKQSQLLKGARAAALHAGWQAAGSALKRHMRMSRCWARVACALSI